MHAAHHRITGTQGAFSYQDGGDGASARVDFGFHHMTAGEFIGIGFEFQYFGLKQYHFQQFVNPLGLFGRADLAFAIARRFSHTSRDYTSAKDYGETDGMRSEA